MRAALRPARFRAPRRPGFTLVELLVGSTVMLIVVIGALGMYTRSNRVSVDQQALAQVQHDVRSGMFFLTRDSRSAGVGLSEDVSGYFLQGRDQFGPSPEASDSLQMLGNFDEPLGLRMRQYQGGLGGGAATGFLYDWELENSPYPCPTWFEQRNYLIISTKCPGCFAYRFVDVNAVHGCGSGTAHIDFQPGHSDINPPGGLVDTLCDDSCYDDALITLGDIRLYWLDTTGNPGDYPELNLAVGVKGYLGVPNTLYRTTTTEAGAGVNIPLAQNIENLQFEYNGDFDDDGNLDGYQPWDTGWTLLAGDDAATKATKMELIARIRQVRIMLLGRTPNPFTTVSGTPPPAVDLYRRPAMSNSPAQAENDLRRRFLVESVANVRNMSLSLYNTGQR